MFIISPCKDRNESIIPHEVNRFPDRTLAIGHLSNTFNKITWIYEGDDELFTLICLRNHTRANEVHLTMPYIPHARMDRTENGEVFTLQAFCNTINSLNFTDVTVFDPHSNVSIALLDRIIVISPKRQIFDTIDEIKHLTNSDKPPVLFFPDEGAMKRYSKVFGKDFQIAFGIKQRDWGTGKILGLDIMNAEVVKDKDILIVDDLCSYGGTFRYSAIELIKAGAKNVYLYVSHCEKSVYRGAMYSSDLIKHIYTTDSTGINPSAEDKISIIHQFISTRNPNGKGSNY